MCINNNDEIVTVLCCCSLSSFGGQNMRVWERQQSHQLQVAWELFRVKTSRRRRRSSSVPTRETNKKRTEKQNCNSEIVTNCKTMEFIKWSQPRKLQQKKKTKQSKRNKLTKEEKNHTRNSNSNSNNNHDINNKKFFK